MQLFWEQERAPAAPAALTSEEEKCEDLFVRTHTQTAAGRYMVKLPFAVAPTTLMDTRKPAERLLHTMERKGERDPQFSELYRTFMNEYADLQLMKMSSPATSPQVNYLLHHGVLRESSTTTKLRWCSMDHSALGQVNPSTVIYSLAQISYLHCLTS